MRKFIFALPIIIFALSAGCATAPADESITYEEKPTDNKYTNEYTYEDYQPPVYKLPEYTLYEKNYPLCEDPPQEDPPCECSGLSEYEREQLRVWTVEELGEIIVASGNFWNDWWDGTDRFHHYHFGDIRGEAPSLPPGVYVQLLPTSGFESLSEIHDYLLQFYTAAWVDAQFALEFAPFAEYDNVLFMHDVRACFPRSDWETASHTLIEQHGCRAVIETTTLKGDWPHIHLGFSYPVTETYRFVFINGRIHGASVCRLFGEPIELP